MGKGKEVGGLLQTCIVIVMEFIMPVITITATVGLGGPIPITKT